MDKQYQVRINKEKITKHYKSLGLFGYAEEILDNKKTQLWYGFNRYIQITYTSNRAFVKITVKLGDEPEWSFKKIHGVHELHPFVKHLVAISQ